MERIEKERPPKPDARKTPLADIKSFLPIGDAKPMSKTESSQSQEPLIQTLTRIWELMDEWLTMTNRAGQEAFIWRKLDDIETAKIANALLQSAVNNPVAAAAVRGLIETHKKFEVGLILLPEFLETYHFYMRYGFMLPRLPMMAMKG